MSKVNPGEAKARLTELIERAAAGELVQILRREKPAAIDKPQKKIALETLKVVTDGTPMQREDARKFVRRMRDDERY